MYLMSDKYRIHNKDYYFKYNKSESKSFPIGKMRELHNLLKRKFDKFVNDSFQIKIRPKKILFYN